MSRDPFVDKNTAVLRIVDELDNVTVTVVPFNEMSLCSTSQFANKLLSVDQVDLCPFRDEFYRPLLMNDAVKYGTLIVPCKSTVNLSSAIKNNYSLNY